MSIQSQLDSPQIQLATFPPRNSHPGAWRSPSSTQHHKSSLEGKCEGAEPTCPVPSPAHTLCMCSSSSTRK